MTVTHDLVGTPSPRLPKTASGDVALTENEFAQKVHLSPRTVRCDCKRAPLIPQFPLIHCPACHETWTARTDHYPARCNTCGFSLRRWRRLNGVSDTPRFMNSSAAADE